METLFVLRNKERLRWLEPLLGLVTVLMGLALIILSLQPLTQPSPFTISDGANIAVRAVCPGEAFTYHFDVTVRVSHPVTMLMVETYWDVKANKPVLIANPVSRWATFDGIEETKSQEVASGAPASLGPGDYELRVSVQDINAHVGSRTSLITVPVSVREPGECE